MSVSENERWVSWRIVSQMMNESFVEQWVIWVSCWTKSESDDEWVIWVSCWTDSESADKLPRESTDDLRMRHFMNSDIQDVKLFTFG